MMGRVIGSSTDCQHHSTPTASFYIMGGIKSDSRMTKRGEFAKSMLYDDSANNIALLPLSQELHQEWRQQLSSHTNMTLPGFLEDGQQLGQ
eukprot:CAMPEP_0183788394 /NCGR_PEP_ID=MMETSP0739-20130205/68040_1 /TAXON_ID=385413 /ORGANISM="Thalassiosira miniscula, Strain CCMP1093" /LENGTH=90 /DNA_ID=CAMNT_0026032513 /DNA_START=380 /DNA_END=652 /DNA_ORIENTATION=-